MVFKADEGTMKELRICAAPILLVLNYGIPDTFALNV